MDPDADLAGRRRCRDRSATASSFTTKPLRVAKAMSDAVIPLMPSVATSAAVTSAPKAMEATMAILAAAS